MTLARRTLLAFCIALATPLVVAGIAIIDGGPLQHLETLHRN